MVDNASTITTCPATHSTWLNFMANSGVKVAPPKGLVLPTKGFGKDLGNGHFTTDNPISRPPGRAWISLYGEDAKADIDAIREELVERLGEGARERVANTNRNLCIFPNLVINDGSSVTVRTSRRWRLTGCASPPGRSVRRGNGSAARAATGRVPDLLRSGRICNAG